MVVAQGEGRVQRGPSKNTALLPKRHSSLLSCAPNSFSKGEIVLHPRFSAPPGEGTSPVWPGVGFAKSLEEAETWSQAAVSGPSSLLFSLSLFLHLRNGKTYDYCVSSAKQDNTYKHVIQCLALRGTNEF